MGDGSESSPPGEDHDDAHLSVEPLRAEEPRSGRSRLSQLASQIFEGRPALVRVAALAVLAALVLATSVTALRGQAGPLFPLSTRATPSPSPGAGRTTPNNTSGPAPTPIPTVPWGQGWVPAGPSEAQHIIFAPSAPAIAYTCGAPGLISLAQPVPIVVERSADHGHTWQPQQTPPTGVECDLTVDPLDAQDLVLAALPAPTIWLYGLTGVPGDVALYRSFDGGATWRSWPLPTAPDGARHFIALQWMWAGAALFVAPYAPGDPLYRRLAVSLGGQAFTWVERNGLFAGATPDAGIVGLISTPTALYVGIFSDQCASTCTHTMRSTDGASWSRLTPTYRGDAVALLPSAGNRTLYGHVLDFSAAAQATGGTYVRALAGDSSWNPLPAPPGNLVISYIWELPDGRIYATLDPFASTSVVLSGLYTLAVGAASWAFIASYPAGGPQSLAFSWDDGGHALALWGAANSFLPNRLTGLEYHAP